MTHPILDEKKQKEIYLFEAHHRAKWAPKTIEERKAKT